MRGITVDTPDGPYQLEGRLADRLRRRQFADPHHAGARFRRPRLRGQFPHRRHRHGGGFSRPSAGSGSIRRSIAASRRCCTSSPTMSGASTSSSAGISTRRRKRSRRTSCARLKAMLGDEPSSNSNGSRSTPSSAAAWSNFRHGRVLFAGDSAHQVSPFGARGANSGLQDTDNLAWKLKLVMDGKAPESLLDTYDVRTRSTAPTRTSSIPPLDRIHHAEIGKRAALFRNAVLDLSEKFEFARPLVNSGRLSVPAIYDGSPLNGPDADGMPARIGPGFAGKSMRRSARRLADRPARQPLSARWLSTPRLPRRSTSTVSQSKV